MALADNFQGLCSPLHPSSEGNVVWPLGIACFATAYTPSVGEACEHAFLFSRFSVNYFYREENIFQKTSIYGEYFLMKYCFVLRSIPGMTNWRVVLA